MPATEPNPSSSSNNLIDWALLIAAAAGYLIVYLAVLYSSPRMFVAGLAFSGLVAAGSGWVHFIHKPRQKANASTTADLEMENRFDWPKVFKRRCAKIASLVRSLLK